MNELELKADIAEALENMNKWRPVYTALLRVCENKDQAIEALEYLVRLESEVF